MLKPLVMASLLFAFMSPALSATITLTEQNSVLFNQQVSGEYTAKKTLEILAKSAKASPIYLVLDTPGGSVSAGLQFIDAIKSLNVKVHTITIFAASMGYQIVQELGTRYILPSGTLMSHRGAVSGMSGQIPGELTSRINFIQSLLDGMSERAAKRVSMSKEAYDAAIVNELWVYGQAAVLSKHADEVANVRCSKELINGTYTESVRSIFGGADVTFSKCPLISAPISINFGSDVKREHVDHVKKQIMLKNRRGFLTF
jgi:ATP-dependent Clp protease protease subunit